MEQIAKVDLLESEYYTAEQLKVKTQRIDSNYLDKLQQKYENAGSGQEGGDEEEDEYDEEYDDEYDQEDTARGQQ